jgi:hypothetical protein
MIPTVSQKCQYCKIDFHPTRRFVQKYCSESCRVLSCRERKFGALSGINKPTKVRTTNVSMVELMKIQHAESLQVLKAVKQHVHYIEIGGIVKFIYDWYQNTKKEKNVQQKQKETDNLKGLVGVLIAQNKDIKTDLEVLSKINPEYSEMFSNLI